MLGGLGRSPAAQHYIPGKPFKFFALQAMTSHALGHKLRGKASAPLDHKMGE